MWKIQAKEDSFDWSEFDNFIDTEEANEEVAKGEEIPLREFRIDWWSKFYSSNGHPEKAPDFEK